MSGLGKKVKEFITGQGGKETEERKVLGSDLARADAMRPEHGPLPQELINQLGKEYYLLVDDLTLALLHASPQFQFLIPAFSHLSRTTRITRKDAQIQMLEMECMFDEHTMQMEEDDFDHEGWAEIRSYLMFGKDVINDKVDGHRGRLITDKIKILEARVMAEKKRGMLPSR